MSSLVELQQEICQKFAAPYFPADDWLKIGVGKGFDPAQIPINGLRHPPEGDTTGWYISSREDFSDEEDFSDPIHVIHLKDQWPEIVKYFGLAPVGASCSRPGMRMSGSMRTC